MTDTVKIIAEAGVNHNGDIDMARRLIEVAALSGADVVKFQTFVAKELVTDAATQAGYQQERAPAQNQFEMLRKLELSREAHFELKRYAEEKGIDFMSSPFDFGSLSFLVRELDVAEIKLGSGELTNAPLLFEAAKSGKPLIISTGMATLEEVGEALGVIACGFKDDSRENELRRDHFKTALHDPVLMNRVRERVTLLQCTSAYPAAVEHANLRVMDTFVKGFGVKVGFSDHTLGIEVALAAAARGASVIEKHFTIDRNLPGPDHKASLEPEELCQMVMAIRRISAALGNGIKRPCNEEVENAAVARKSIVARHPVSAGETLTSENLTVKRPSDGVSPMEWWDILGLAAKRDFQTQEAIEL